MSQPSDPIPPADEAYRPNIPADDRSRMVKQIKGYLNKITPEKYEVLARQIVAFFEPSTSDAIVPLIFEKALNELTFAEMYADLFRDLLHKVATCTQSHTTFLMALMLRCNLELTNALQTDEAEAEKNKDKPDVERKVLKRSVGIIQFIGELFVRDMLKEEFLFKVVTKLLHLNEPTCANVKQLEAEVACRLIETAGAHWESSSQRFKTEVLPRLDDLCENHPKPRIRFLLLDLQELRQRGWQHRFAKQKPKKLHEDGLLRQGSNTDNPLTLRDGFASLGLADGRSMHDPYGQFQSYQNEAKPRSATPPPARAISMVDPYQQRKRGMTPPPQRVMPFMPGVHMELPTLPLVPPVSLGSPPTSPLPVAALPMPHASSQPPSPAPMVYQHNPYGSPQPSPLPSPQPAVPQMQWAEVSQTSWQQTGVEEPPHWQQQPQQQSTGMQWQQQDAMGWQTPDSQMQWSGQVWTEPHSASSIPTPMSPSLMPMSMPLSGQLPLQLPLPVVRQPIPIIDPKHLDQGEAGIIQIGPKLEKGAMLPPNSGDGKSRRDSPMSRQLPIDANSIDLRARPLPTPEYAYPIDPMTHESLPRPSQRRVGTPRSRALPIEPPVNPPGTPPPQSPSSKK